MSLLSMLWRVTWQFRNSFLTFFCHCSLNRRDLFWTLLRNGMLCSYFTFLKQKSFFPFLYPFHILLFHVTICAYFQLLRHTYILFLTPLVCILCILAGPIFWFGQVDAIHVWSSRCFPLQSFWEPIRPKHNYEMVNKGSKKAVSSKTSREKLVMHCI